MKSAPLEHARTSVARLRKAYENYTRNPTPHAANWNACETAYTAAQSALAHEDVARSIDALLTAVLSAGHATPSQALRSLLDADTDVMQAEHALARGLGFDEGFVSKHVAEAVRFLNHAVARKQKLSHVKSASDLTRVLARVRSLVVSEFEKTKSEPKKRKSAHRKDVSEHSQRQLYAVGAVVANAAQVHLFAYSHALAIAVSQMPGKRRRHLRRRAADH